MSNGRLRNTLRWVATTIRRLRGGVIAHALADSGDAEIDAALVKRGLTRADLFTPRGALARYRLRMAYMLVAWRIDVPRAVAEHWEEIKIADKACSRCANTGRCQRWLAWGTPNTAPLMFCPNAKLLAEIAAEQSVTDVLRHCSSRRA